MANFTLAPTASVSIKGITPAAGPTATTSTTGSYSVATPDSIDDRLSATYTVNASTVDAALDLGKITAGKFIWLQCDGTLHLTITQDLGAGPVDAVVKVEKFMLLHSGFTALKVTNPSATTGVHMSLIVGGDRDPVGGGPGVF